MSSSPPASNHVARRTMVANRSTDTKPERLLRSELHARGLRYRKNVRLDAGRNRARPDLVFSRARVAVFVDGCFWHRCPSHGTEPRANADFWREKLDRNVSRDRANDTALGAAGWIVVRVWEHEDPVRAADRVCAALALRRVDPANPRARLEAPAVTDPSPTR